MAFWRDVGVETFGVFLGAGLALLTSAGIERFGEQQLVRDARDLVFSELRQNRTTIIRKLAEIEALDARIAATLGNPEVELNENDSKVYLLPNSAWLILTETSALRYMPSADRRMIATTYSGQDVFSTRQGDERHRWIDIVTAESQGRPLPERQTARLLRRWRQASRDTYRSGCKQVVRIDAVLGVNTTADDYERCDSDFPSKRIRSPAPRAPRS